MTDDTTALALGAAAIAVALVLSKRVKAFPMGGQLSVQDTLALVRKTLSRFYFPNVSEIMLLTVIEIESDRRPLAIRAEPHIKDFSAGLTQTLVGTAAWMHDIGYRSFPKPEFVNSNYDVDDPRRITESPARILFDPEAAAYYGAGYLQWLYDYFGQDASDETIIRAYNGGPKNGPTSSGTAYHWQKYQEARTRLVAQLGSAVKTGVS